MIGIGTPSSQSRMAPTIAFSMKLINRGTAARRGEFQKRLPEIWHSCRDCWGMLARLMARNLGYRPGSARG
jgi:hypothetical protein